MVTKEENWGQRASGREEGEVGELGGFCGAKLHFHLVRRGNEKERVWERGLFCEGNVLLIIDWASGDHFTFLPHLAPAHNCSDEVPLFILLDLPSKSHITWHSVLSHKRKFPFCLTREVFLPVGSVHSHRLQA